VALTGAGWPALDSTPAGGRGGGAPSDSEAAAASPRQGAEAAAPKQIKRMERMGHRTEG